MEEEEFKADEIIEDEVVEKESQEDEVDESEIEQPEEVIQEPDDNDEIPVRKSAKDFIIERQKRKIEKLSKKEQDDDYFEEQPEDDSGLVRKIIQEELEPLKRNLLKSKDEEELKQVLGMYPEAKKLESRVRKYMETEAYSQVPVEFIVRGLLGAREATKQKAEIEAKKSKQGGHSKRPTDVKPKTAWDMTEEEFLKDVSEKMSRR
jgi:hypothetical protein